MAKQYKAAIFDLDGTLLDSLCDLHISVNHALCQMGYAERSLDEIRNFVGNGVGVLVQRAVPEGTTDVQVKQCLQLFKQHYVVHCREHTAPYEGIMPLLYELRQRSIRTAIVSNKLQAGVDELYESHFCEVIDIPIGEHDGVQRKPAPDMVDEAIARLNVRKADCLYIGDSEVDAQTARNAGVDDVSVLWGFRDERTLRQAGATRFVSHPSELLQFFADR